MSMELPKAEVWIYDIETLSNLFTLTAKQVGSQEKRVYLIGLGRCDALEIHNFMYKPAHQHPTLWFAGYNNREFDDQVIAYIIEHVAQLKRWGPEKAAEAVYNKSQAIISNKSFYTEPQRYFQSIDLYRIPRLHYNRKGLKLVGVNLKWPRIQDMPVSHTATVDESDLPVILGYNENDVDLTGELFKNQRGEVQLRNEISVAYGVDVMSEDRSGIANRLLEKFYSEATGRHPRDFKKERTERSTVAMADVIHADVAFRTKGLQNLLVQMRREVIDIDWLRRAKPKQKDERYKWSLFVGETAYDVALGGLHSNSRHYPLIAESDEEGTLIDRDVSSYYPSIVLRHHIKPAHLTDAYLMVFEQLFHERLEAKRLSKTDPAMATKAETLKIVLNAGAFGKLGDEKYWMYDMLALYRVTINGELYLLMLIERLEEAGIHVWYANTDGIIAKVRKEQEAEYDAICHGWEEELGFTLETTRFKKAVVRDVNEYVMEKENGVFKAKGDLDYESWKDVTKSFNMPVEQLAIQRYFFEGKPVMETLTEHGDILDFCKAQNVGRQYQLEYHTQVSTFNRHGMPVTTLGVEELQRTIRFFVSKRGGSLQKRKEDGRLEALSGTKGETVYVLNSLPESEAERKALLTLVDYSYYERECNRYIVLFERQQAALEL